MNVRNHSLPSICRCFPNTDCTDHSIAPKPTTTTKIMRVELRVICKSSSLPPISWVASSSSIVTHGDQECAKLQLFPKRADRSSITLQWLHRHVRAFVPFFGMDHPLTKDSIPDKKRHDIAIKWSIIFIYIPWGRKYYNLWIGIDYVLELYQLIAFL